MIASVCVCDVFALQMANSAIYLAAVVVVILVVAVLSVCDCQLILKFKEAVCIGVFLLVYSVVLLALVFFLVFLLLFLCSELLLAFTDGLFLSSHKGQDYGSELLWRRNEIRSL